MTQISRRNVNKGLAWSVPAVVAAGVAPAFAASNTGPTDPPVDPTPVTLLIEAEAAVLTLRAQRHSTAAAGTTATTTAGNTYTVESIPNASAQGAVNFIGGGNGTAIFSFVIPAGATNIGLQMLHLPHPTSTRIRYTANGTAVNFNTLQTGTGLNDQTPVVETLDASGLVAGSNTVTFGNNSGEPFGYLDAIRVTYTPAV